MYYYVIIVGGVSLTGYTLHMTPKQLERTLSCLLGIPPTLKLH